METNQLAMLDPATNTMADLIAANNGDGGEVQTIIDKIYLTIQTRPSSDHKLYSMIPSIRKNIFGPEGATIFQMNPLKVKTTALAEGDPGVGQTFSQKSWKITSTEYGDYMTWTNRVDNWMTVKPIAEITSEMTRVGMASRDAILMEIIEAQASTVIEGAGLTEMDITAADIPSIATMVAIIDNFAVQNIKAPSGRSLYPVLMDEIQHKMLFLDPIVQSFMKIGNDNSPFKRNSIPDMLGLTFETVNYDRTDVNANPIFATTAGNKACPMYIWGENAVGINGGQIQSVFKGPGQFVSKDIFNMYSAMGWYMPMYGGRVIKPEAIVRYVAAITA